MPASTHTHLFMWPASWGPVPGRKPRKPLLVLAFMWVGVGLPGQGGVVLFVNTGQGGVVSKSGTSGTQFLHPFVPLF